MAQSFNKAVQRFQQIKAREKREAQEFKALPDKIRKANPNRTERAIEALMVLASDARGKKIKGGGGVVA